MKVFVDTGALIAFFIKQETFHEEVTEKFDYYYKQGAILLTSNLVVDELFTWFSRNQNPKTTRELIATLEEASAKKHLRIIYVDEVISKQASEVLLKFYEHKISFTDATTYVFCKEFKIDEVFSLDADFKKMGLVVSP